MRLPFTVLLSAAIVVPAWFTLVVEGAPADPSASATAVSSEKSDPKAAPPASSGPAAMAPKSDTAAATPAAAAAKPPVMPPPKGSQVPADKNSCILCHGEKDLWEGDQLRMFISTDDLKKDVHWQKGVNCHDCHGGNYDTQDKNQAHAIEDGFRAKLADIRKFCASCHKNQALELVKGVHDKAGEKNERGQGTPLQCEQCHGKLAHSLLPVRDLKSPVFLDNQVKTCGNCHSEYMGTYLKSMHGQGLDKLGLLVTAVCSDCHGAHGIYRAPDQRSTLHVTRVADTCGKCHRFIEDRLQASIHGHGGKAGGVADRNAPGGNGKQRPSCTSCHQKHDLPDVDSLDFRLQVPNRCGNCHANLSSRYAMSIHGKLTELGYNPAAKCSDCHGAHDILPVSDPRSHLSAENRAETCKKCHANVAGSFVKFDPHTDHTDPERSPIVHLVYQIFMTLLLTTFGFFGLHSVLWFLRALVDFLLHGRARRLKPGERAYVRFAGVHRLGHAVLVVSFLGLALTGLPLKYSHTDWAKFLAQGMGGFASTGFWHRFFGVVLFVCLAVYMLRLVWQFFVGRGRGIPVLRLIFGPDSPVPTWRDIKDFFKMLRWFVGLGPKPTFERWAYWEKVDFWGAAADTVIIGFTGLVLWFPGLFCKFLPAVVVNIAQVIHSTQALLATGFVFAIHFFNTHLRADKFPADMSVLTGLVSEHEFQEERPEYFERLRRQGDLEKLATTSPSRAHLYMLKAAGFTALAIGLALLLGMIVAAFGG